jgi:hypothetical protein
VAVLAEGLHELFDPSAKHLLQTKVVFERAFGKKARDVNLGVLAADAIDATRSLDQPQWGA